MFIHNLTRMCIVLPEDLLYNISQLVIYVFSVVYNSLLVVR